MNIIDNNPDPNMTDETESFDYKFKQLQFNRSNFTTSCSYTPFSNNGEGELKNNDLSSQLLKGHICSDELSNQFFSKCNINYIQQLLKQNIYVLSNQKYLIGEQSETELLIIMRHIFLNDRKQPETNISHMIQNNPSQNIKNNNDIISQINELNNSVIKKCVPFILVKIEQKNEYIKDINNSLSVMEHPQNVNSSSTRTTLLGSSKQLL